MYRMTLAQAEAIRRVDLGHEASVKSIGSLHYLGLIFFVFALGAFVFNLLFQNRQIRGAMEPEQSVFIIMFFVFLAAMKRALAIGFYRVETLGAVDRSCGDQSVSALCPARCHGVRRSRC